MSRTPLFVVFLSLIPLACSSSGGRGHDIASAGDAASDDGSRDGGEIDGGPADAPDYGVRFYLREGWALRSSAELDDDGATISTPDYDTADWHPAGVPSTVRGTLLENGLYGDPHEGMAFRDLPGVTYGVGADFSNMEIVSESPFYPSWWYRRSFELAAEDLADGGRFWLTLDGVNYRANVWVNGDLVADETEIVGTYRFFELDLTEHVRVGDNALALEIRAPSSLDLAHSWVDWNPMSPDKAMGLWREVWWARSGPMRLRHPFVRTALEGPPESPAAALTVIAEATNTTSEPLDVEIEASFEGVSVVGVFTLPPGEPTRVALRPDEHPELRLSTPRLWWPVQMGEPELYDLDIVARVDGAVSDVQATSFAIRTVTSELNEHGARVFRVNGQPILIRAAGWARDIFMMEAPEKLAAELAYVVDMNLNAVRFEGKFPPDWLLDAFDRAGILVIAGWCCCDHWERTEWLWLADETWDVAAASQRDQVLRLRNHPSLLTWWYGSDIPPSPEAETMYLDVLASYDWPNPALSSASEAPTEVSGATGVKMNGPYEWVPPNYWLADPGTYGGAWSFATEVSPGPAPPGVESLRRMLTDEHLWPPDAVWEFHCGGNEFDNLRIFDAAMEARLGAPTDAFDYARKAQLLAYEGERAMFEAFRRKKYVATGVVQWMLNNAWPSLIWHLYDYYLIPGGGYFGTKLACEPVHALYDYTTREVVVVNGTRVAHDELSLRARVVGTDMATRFDETAAVSVAPDGTSVALTLPAPGEDWTTAHFLVLDLSAADGTVLGRNVYTLSTQEDELDWEASDWHVTPTLQQADLTSLSDLPHAQLAITAVTAPLPTQASAGAAALVSLENRGTALAFHVRLRALDSPGGDEIVPVLWEDNYVTLLPGESRDLRVRWPGRAQPGDEATLRVDGWNVSPVERRLLD